MTADMDWEIPPSVLHWLSAVPENAAVAMLLRHSVRDHLPPGEAGNTLPITEPGARLARELGAMLGTRIRSLYTSPLLRCTQTAEAMRAGAALDTHIHLDRLLGDPGVYVIDGELAIENWQKLGHEGVMACLVSHDEPLPGMAAPDAAARFLVRHMLATAGMQAGLHIFVTHDSLVTATAARIIGKRLDVADWPWFLEAGFFWQDRNIVTAAYRESHRCFDSLFLSKFVERDAVEFARREIA